MSNALDAALARAKARTQAKDEGPRMVKFLNKGFTVTKVYHQRNGVGGRPFHAVHFTCADSAVPLVAILPYEAESGECFVVSPETPEEAWRGDRFQEDVARAVHDYQAERDAYFKRLVAKKK